METALHDQERRHHIVVASDATKRRRPFPIARLNSLWFVNSIEMRNDHLGLYHIHHKSGLVKVVEVAVEDAVFRAHIRDQLQSRPNDYSVFAGPSLVIVDAIETHLQLLKARNEAVWPILPNGPCAAFLE